MPQINVGAVANDHTGDPLRTAFQKINQYGQVGDKTVNAAFYKTSGNTNEAAITLAIAAAALLGSGAVVWVPVAMLPYNASLVTFNNAVLMIRESGDPAYSDVKAYGAAGNGVADDTVAIQAAINYAIAATGVGNPVFFPSTAGLYYIVTATLIIRGAQNVAVIGGAFATGQTVDPVALKWNGTSGGTVILIDKSRDCTFSDFSIVPGTTIPGIGIDCDQQSAGNPITTNLTFRRIHVDTTSVAAWRIAHSATATNCDLFTFENIQLADGLAGHTGDAIRIENSQSKFHRFFGGTIGTRNIGINTSTGTGGSFQCFGVNFSLNNIDANLGAATDTIGFYGCQSENAGRFLATLFSTAGAPIVIQSCRLDTNAVNGDNNYFACSGVGPYMLIGNDFAGGVQRTTVRWAFTSNPSVVVISRGNIYPNTTPFASAQFGSVLSSIGDVAVGGGGSSTQILAGAGGSLGGSTVDTERALTWGATPALDVGQANYFTLNATSNIAAVIAIPTNNPPASGNGFVVGSQYALSQEIAIAIRNSSGGALSTAPTFNTGAGGFKFSAVTNPANGTQVVYRFRWDPVQSFWYEVGTHLAAGL